MASKYLRDFYKKIASMTRTRQTSVKTHQSEFLQLVINRGYKQASSLYKNDLLLLKWLFRADNPSLIDSVVIL